MNTRFFAFLTILIAATLLGFAGLSVLGPQRGAVTTGEALVGGPFTLTAHTGERVSDATYRGKFMLVIFGFTYCPDVCPTELQVVAAALDELGENAADIQPLFVTIDPARDTAAALATYVKNFHPKLVGLTGTNEEIRKIAAAYRVYYARVKGGSGADYLMDHSSIIYLMGRDGRFLKHFSFGTDATELAQGITRAIGG
ncbi:MAG: SCO family protein [Pseudomonadota bacterium]|nr:SCO family protein [Pseudomonadota bacterium]